MIQSPTWRDRTKVALALLVGGAIATHFTLTAAYVAPPSPLKLAMQPAFDAYMEPYFAQRWSLFAPDPVTDMRELLLSCRVRNDAGAIEETPFTDITAPLRAMKARYRLTPADGLARVQSGALHLVFGAPEEITKKALEVPEEQAPDGVKRWREELNEDSKRKRKEGERMVARIGSAECDRLYGRGRTTQVRVRMAVVLPRPYSARNDATVERTVRFKDFDWADYERVAPF
jgi:hypothetical protein